MFIAEPVKKRADSRGLLVSEPCRTHSAGQGALGRGGGGVPVRKLFFQLVEGEVPVMVGRALG